MSGLQDVKLHLVDSIDDVLKLRSWLGDRRPYHALAVDTETTGLRIGHDIVRLAQIGDGAHGWAIPWTNEVGQEGRFIGGWAGVFADVVKLWDGDWLMHNGPFDHPMLKHMRIDMPKTRIIDTQVEAHIMAPHLSTALKNVADRLVDGSSSQARDKLALGTWTWDTVPIDY